MNEDQAREIAIAILDEFEELPAAKGIRVPSEDREGREEGAWSVPKGLVEDNEEPLETAKREFREETGFAADGQFIELGQLKQPSKKIVHAWALEMDVNARELKSNTFPLEWPKGSGDIREFPEVDRGEWFDLEHARTKIIKGQAEFLDRLAERLWNMNRDA